MLRYAQERKRVSPAVVRFPGWLVFLLFVPLQIWFFLELKDLWGFWWTILFFLVLGVLGNRAARAPWLRALFFPHSAYRWERRRHIYQGVLFILAAATFVLPAMSAGLPPRIEGWALAWPQPWLPLTFLVTLVKSSVR